MSLIEEHKRSGTFELTYMTFEGRKRSEQFRDRKRAEAYARVVDDIYEQGRAFIAMRETTGAILGLTDDERYDRDFEVFKSIGNAECMLPDPTWRSAMRKRARRAGLTINTLDLTYNHRSRTTALMVAWHPREDNEESLKATRAALDGTDPTPESAEQRKIIDQHLETVLRELNDWERRGHLQVIA